MYGPMDALPTTKNSSWKQRASKVGRRGWTTPATLCPTCIRLVWVIRVRQHLDSCTDARRTHADAVNAVVPLPSPSLSGIRDPPSRAGSHDFSLNMIRLGILCPLPTTAQTRRPSLHLPLFSSFHRLSLAAPFRAACSSLGIFPEPVRAQNARPSGHGPRRDGTDPRSSPARLSSEGVVEGNTCNERKGHICIRTYNPLTCKL